MEFPFGDNPLMSEFFQLGLLIKIHVEGRKEEINKIMVKNNLTKQELHFLMFLMHNANQSVSSIAQTLDLSSSTVVIRINKLEKKGYVSRVRLDDNRRKVKINITEKGLEVVKSLKPPFVDMIIKLIHSMNSTELDVLKKILQKTNAILNPDNIYSNVDLRKLMKMYMEL